MLLVQLDLGYSCEIRFVSEDLDCRSIPLFDPSGHPGQGSPIFFQAGCRSRVLSSRQYGWNSVVPRRLDHLFDAAFRRLSIMAGFDSCRLSWPSSLVRLLHPGVCSVKCMFWHYLSALRSTSRIISIFSAPFRYAFPHLFTCTLPFTLLSVRSPLLISSSPIALISARSFALYIGVSVRVRVHRFFCLR